MQGSSVSPGQRFTYKWKVLEGPSVSDPPCISYLYYSATDFIQDTNSGLVGPLLVCRKGALGDNHLQVGPPHFGVAICLCHPSVQSTLWSWVS